MSPAELAPAPPRVPDGGERLLCGWGRRAPTRARVLRPRTAEEVAEALRLAAARGGAIARGAARSYGDAAQNGGGVVLDATALREPCALDAARAEVRVGAGRTFAEVLLHLAARGLTLPVVPGTRHLTVGGALAADVHGKNHLRDGSLARHVESVTLCTPAAGPQRVSRERDPELLHATLGGMGLTGVMVEATLRVAPLRSPLAVADVDRLDGLEQAVALVADAPHRYAIAWLDLLSPGAACGRAVVTRSDEAPASAGGTGRSSAAGAPEPGRGAGAAPRPPFALRPRLTVPRGFPPGVLRPATVRAFNAWHWRTAPRRARGHRLTMSAQLFPLDVLGEWSRLYGPGGMVQYQFALPAGRGGAGARRAPAARAPCADVPRGAQALRPGGGGPAVVPAAGSHARDRPARRGTGAVLHAGRGRRAGRRRRRAGVPRQGRTPAPRGARDDVPRAGALARGARGVRPRRGAALGHGPPPGVERMSVTEQGRRAWSRGTEATRASSSRVPEDGGARRVLVLGGTSEIAGALVRELAGRGPCEVVLAGRDAEGLRAAGEGLRAAGCARVETVALEACEVEGHRAAVERGVELLGGCDLVVLAVGVLGEGGLPQDVRRAVEVLEVNVVGAGSLLLESARALRERGSGTIVVLSSVAAVRPRASAAVYCASKAGLDALAQGLGDALAPAGVRVVVVRPGFVRTRMTRGLPVPPLACDPETVARATVRGLERGAHTVWAPGALRWVMTLLRLMPRPLFRRLPL